MWNVAHNLGGFLAPIIVGGCAKAFGWRWGMWAPGAIGLTVACFVLAAVRDRPTDLGYPAVDGGAAAKKPDAAAAPVVPAAAPLKGEPAGSSKWRQLAAGEGAGKQAPPAAAVAAAAEAPKAPAAKTEDGMMGALKSVIKLPAIWALAFTYFFVYVVRQGVTSWLVFYLMAEKGAADAASAALTVSGVPLLQGRWGELQLSSRPRRPGSSCAVLQRTPKHQLTSAPCPCLPHPLTRSQAWSWVASRAAPARASCPTCPSAAPPQAARPAATWGAASRS